MATLTKRQKQMVDYLENYIDEHGYAPTLAEVGEYFGLSSLATVHKHLRNLENKGFIRGCTIIAGRWRSPVKAMAWRRRANCRCLARLLRAHRLRQLKATIRSRCRNNSSVATTPSACGSRASEW